MQMGVFMKKIRDYPFLIIMVILILGISFINFAKKDTEFAERRLQKLFWANKKITASSKEKMDTCLISN